MLQDDTRRPWSTKQRILSRHGHLSNDAAAQVAGEIVSAELRHLFLGHLSSDCNRPALAQRVVSETLAHLGNSCARRSHLARHARFNVRSRRTACAGPNSLRNSQPRSSVPDPARAHL
jgi:hypothetical protein